MAITVCSRCKRDQHEQCTSPEVCQCEECHPAPVVWGDPPGSGRGPRRPCPITSEQRAALRARPGQWALCATFDKPTAASSEATKIRKGKHREIDPAAFEVMPRKLADDGKGSSGLWARYIGEDAG